MPALTKPIVITVVAPELWIAAVPSVPMPTPRSVLETPIVTSVELTGNSEIESTEKLMEAVTIKPGQRLNRRILHENVVAVQQVYIKDDYVMAKVHDLDVKEDGKLVLRVNEGILEGIKVKGNKKTVGHLDKTF